MLVWYIVHMNDSQPFAHDQVSAKSSMCHVHHNVSKILSYEQKPECKKYRKIYMHAMKLGPGLNIEMSSYQYRYSHYKD